MYSRNSLHVALKEEIEFDPTDVDVFDGGDERERLRVVWSLIRYARFSFSGRRAAIGAGDSC